MVSVGIGIRHYGGAISLKMSRARRRRRAADQLPVGGAAVRRVGHSLRRPGLRGEGVTGELMISDVALISMFTV